MCTSTEVRDSSRRLLAHLGVVLLLPTLGCSNAGEPGTGPPVRTELFYSPSFTVDKIYRSMKGPQNFTHIQLGDASTPELLWITGYKTEIVDSESLQKVSAEFMCHNNLDMVDSEQHFRAFDGEPTGNRTNRLFTLSQGQMGVELPSGFGLPVLSTEKYKLATQVLNLNPIEEPIEVRYRTTIDYVRAADVETPLKPLYQKAVQGQKLIEGEAGSSGVAEGQAAAEHEHGESCSVEQHAGHHPHDENADRRFTSHWVVAPGHEEIHTPVTERLGLRADTTVHHISVHLHPFAESLELRDLTTGESVFKSSADNRAEKVGLANVESYSSAEGLKLYKDHEYTLISIYHNDSGEAQDAMAVMLLYMLDQHLESPILGRVF